MPSSLHCRRPKVSEHDTQEGHENNNLEVKVKQLTKLNYEII